MHIPSGLYLVILRGNSRQDICFSDIDRIYFESLVEEVLKQLEEAHYKRVTIDDIIGAVCMRFNVGEVELRSKRKFRRLTQITQMMGYLQA